MPKSCDENKTRLSALSQFIDFLSKHHGITETNDLMEHISGYSISSINKAKRELRLRTYSQEPIPNSVNGNCEPIPKCEPIRRNLFPNCEPIPIQPRARAYKESSSKINNTTNKQNTESEQVDSWHPFNGSTDLIVGVVCEWVHDVDLAKSWIREALALAGNDAEIVQSAILTTKKKLAAGQMITSPPRFTDGIIQKLKGNKAQDKAVADKTKANNSAMLKADPRFRLEDYLPAPYDPNDPNDKRGELPDDDETWI